MDYDVRTFHWFVPCQLEWSDWSSFVDDDFYYDVWF